MVVLYVKGQRVGTLSESEKLLPGILAGQEELEFRDESGGTLAKYAKVIEPLCPWRPELTREDVDRISAAGGGIPLSEFWKRMGVQ